MRGKTTVITLALLMLALTLSLTTALASSGETSGAGYQPAEGNAENLGALLADLALACESPSDEAGVSDGAARRIDADLEAVRAVSETDYAIAAQIAAHWRAVYLDPDYELILYSGGERATELEDAGYRDGDIEAIVVLGYELQNGEMTDELKGRCDAAAAAARSLPSAIIVLTGGATGRNNPEGHTEAGLMRAYLTEQCGVDDARIFTDESAMNTVDNALNTFAILEREGVHTMTVVTSGYHQRRGQAIYNAVGAVYRAEHDYAVEIVGNYCYDIEPSQAMYIDDHGMAARQLGQVLNLPNDVLNSLGR